VPLLFYIVSWYIDDDKDKKGEGQWEWIFISLKSY
jgi:hypothetical protein